MKRAAKKVVIISKQNGMALTSTESTENGSPVVIAEKDGSAKQNWTIEESEGYVKLVNEFSGKVLDLVAYGVANGSLLQQWESVKADSQLWTVKETENGCKIVPKMADKCVDIVGISSQPGARIQLWDDVNGDNQLWILEPVKKPRKKAVKKSILDEAAEAVKEVKPKVTRAHTMKAKTADTEAAPKKKVTRKKAAPKTKA